MRSRYARVSPVYQQFILENPKKLSLFSKGLAIIRILDRSYFISVRRPFNSSDISSEANRPIKKSPGCQRISPALGTVELFYIS